MSQDREPHNGFEKSATFYLEAAQTALAEGRPRLAVHLFRAAFETESSFGPLISTPILEGMRKAIELALELGDRSTADSLLTDLAPHNSPEQNEQAALRLQALALDQLEDMGVTEHDIENVMGVLSHEVLGIDGEHLIDSIKSALEQLGSSLEQDGEPQEPRQLPSVEAIVPALPRRGDDERTGLSRVGRGLRDATERARNGEQQRRLNYQSLEGFDQTLAHMRDFGFLTTDNNYQRFVEYSAAMHGLPQLALDGAFLFFGPSREDVSLFAHATAGEIGFPLLHVSVDLDDQGNGTIKLAGPFKRGLFGSPPDLMDMAVPCTVLIENIDSLQEMFDNEQQALRNSGGRVRNMAGGHGRSMQAEVTGYLRALSSKPGIILMATARDKDRLREPLRSLLGAVHEIEVPAPDCRERHNVLVVFGSEHPSFMELDIKRVAELSEGLSRNELIFVAHAAVESAYRASLRTGIYTEVTMADIMVQLASYLDHDSPLYQEVEDEAVSQFAAELEQDM
ncbi:MAG: hypothetical protein LBH64_04980 [Coriobacteriales bacterium]|jgi:hypothetical protein|nr:hypothetical protein [Coriobacteriales bacterium]